MINLLQASEASMQANAGQFFSMDTYTPVKLTGGKKNPMQGKVFKSVTGMIAQTRTSYENAVNKKIKTDIIKTKGDLSKMETFVSKPLPWGKRLEDKSPDLIEHKGNLYWQVKPLDNNEPKVQYFIHHDNGNVLPIDKKDIVGLPEKKNENVVVRTIRQDNIVKITINGETFLKAK